MRSLLFTPLLLPFLATSALAQSIIPAADGTGTLVLPDGSTYTITGGTRSGDGANLFHSFEQFGLTAAEMANFLADPSVQNILGRVVGGNASIIDGLMQVSGSSANLYLINPAGILFGPNSALNLDGSFTATTASGIGFGEAGWPAVGDTNYAALVGNPTAFTFGSEPGALVNAGNLAVNPGEVITLASGSVITLGTLTAPGGQIIVMAVPGENLVSIRPQGSRLSLELATLPEGVQPGDPLPFSPLDIPELLRGTAAQEVTGLTLNDNGTVSLATASTQLPTEGGTAIAAGTLDVASETGGAVQVLGDRVAVTAATIDASGSQGGGTVHLGGDYRGQGPLPTASRTYVDDQSTIRADAVENGDGGEVIVWAEGGTWFDGTVTARGGATGGDGGFVEISGRDTLAFNGFVDVSAAQGEWGTLLLDPTNITIDSGPPSSPGVDASLPDIFTADLPGDIVINSTVLESQVGNVVLEATNNITIAPGVSLNFVPGGSITFTADADDNLVGAFAMDPTQAINARGTDTTNGRNITISGATVTVGAINTNVPIVGSENASSAGNIAINSTNGGIATGNLNTRICNGFFCTGNAGSITLSAAGGGITTGNLTAFGANGAGGAVSLTTNLGDIALGNVLTDSFGAGGNVTIATASGNVTLGEVNAVSGTSTAGNIELRAGNGRLQVNDDITARTNTGTPGNITLAGNEIDLLLDEFSSVRTQGALVIEPGSMGQAIALGGAGDTGPGVLDLTAADLARLASDFSSISIGNGTGTGNITLGGNVTFSAPTTLQTLGSIDTTGGTLSGIDNASLNLQASQIATGAVSTAGQPITLDGTLGGGSGPVAINGPISSNGGAITITGATPTGNGVEITDPGSLNSGGGDILVTGTSAGGGRGILIEGPITGSSIPIIASQGGAITLTGTSATGSGVSTFFSPVNSGGGDITIEGTSNDPGTVGTGIGLNSPLLSEGGQIRLTGRGSFAGFSSFATRFPPNPVVEGIVDAGTGGVEIVADGLFITRPVLGGGSLVIRPENPALPITLGGTTPTATTFLNADEIAQLGNGFSSRTIGQTGNTGAITLAPFTLTSPLTLNGGVITGPDQNTTWAIDPDGSLVIGGFGAPLRLVSPTEVIGGEDATNTVLGGAGNDTLILVGDGTARFRNIRFSNITAFDGGGGFNTIAGTSGDDYFVVTGNTSGFTLNSDFLSDISFSNVGAIAAGGGQQDVVELAGVPLNMTVTGGDGTLLLTSEGAVTLNADVTTPGNLVISASQGGIAQVGGQVEVGGNTRLDASGNISLLGNNDFNTVNITAAQNVGLRDRTHLKLNDLAFSGRLQVTAAGDLTASRNILPRGGTTPLALAIAGPSIVTTDAIIDRGSGVSLASGGNLTTADITAPGAPITLESGGAITSGNLNSSGGNGGTVTLQAGDRIQVNTINAQGSSLGGAITAITPRTFQALGGFLDQNQVLASLSTVGGGRSGPIYLGYGPFSFTLGDPRVNGTQAAITSGDVTLPPDPANPIVGSRVFGRNQPGEVQLISFGNLPSDSIIPPDTGTLRIEEPIPPDSTDSLSQDEDRPKLTSTGQALQEEPFALLEEEISDDFANHFGPLIKPAREVSLEEAQAILQDIQTQTGEVPAFLYVRFSRSGDNSASGTQAGGAELELLLIPPAGTPTRVQVLNAPRQAVIRAQEQLRRQITNPNLTHHSAHLPTAQRLYNWIIEPIKDELTAAGITNLGFIMDGGLRTMPLAALHNGEQYLIQEYSVGLIPSLGLVDTTYVNLNRQSSALVIGGTSQFINQPPLLAAGVEMAALQNFWPGSTKVADSGFTVEALQQNRRQAQIIHLATHAQFLRGAPEQSYLQFSDGRLRLNQVPDLGWFDPQVELVTLSACQTAMGNLEAELGFAGFALLAGAKSALASLWQVNDEATAGLMTTFYQQLDQEPTKTEALRQAQLAMLREEVYTDQGQLVWPGGTLPLPPELALEGSQSLSHPFYWAAFTIVGSPW